MNKMISKTLMACAVTATLGLASSAALAQTTVFPDFTVNEGSVVGALARTLQADKITGNYVEVATFTNDTSTTGSFTASLKWNAGQFVGTNGTTPVGSQLGEVTENQYGLYALYQANGTFRINGTQTVFTFAPGGSFSLFIDPTSNTVFGQPANGATAWTTTNAGDDILIATGRPTSGEGLLNPAVSTCAGGGGSGINCGSFGTSSSFTLNAAGSQYFVAPNPFYNVSFQSGQLNNFSPTGTQIINGSLDVVFAVPEPTSVALIGLGLLGLGLSRRRKQA